MRRRDFLPILVAAHVALAQSRPNAPLARKGRLKQGVTRGVFAREMSLEDCCREAARLGVQGFDLIGPADWPTLKKYGLTPSMYPPGPGGSIPDALNRRETLELVRAYYRITDPAIRKRVFELIKSMGPGDAA